MLFCSRSNHVLNIIVSSKFWQSCVFWFGVSNITCFLGQIFPHVTMLLSFFFFFLNVGKTCVFFRGDWRFISKASFWVLGFGCFLKMEALGFCGLIWPKCWFFWGVPSWVSLTWKMKFEIFSRFELRFVGYLWKFVEPLSAGFEKLYKSEMGCGIIIFQCFVFRLNESVCVLE